MSRSHHKRDGGRPTRRPHVDIEMRISDFWMQVERRSDDECWIWHGYVEKGYGRWFDGERMVGAHEMALTYATGEVRATGLDTCHACHVPLCCNPSHLRFDTRQSNVDDAVRAQRHAHGETIKQHVLTADAVVVIRKRYAAGATAKTLAQQYGVSPGAIVAVVKGRNWKHVGGPITHRYEHRSKAA